MDDLPPSSQLVLGPATGEEGFIALSGLSEPPERGELVYRTAGQVLTRRWVWRQGRLGSVADDSRLLAVNVDAIEGVTDGKSAADTLQELLGVIGCRVIATLVLGPSSPNADIDI